MLGLTVEHRRASKLPGFRFAFVRCPYERFASGFAFLGTSIKASFRDFVLRREWASPIFVSLCDMLDAPMGFIGRYETLQQDFDRVCDLIGIERRRLPTMHATSHPEYDDETRAVIAEAYREDFVRYGYEA